MGKDVKMNKWLHILLGVWMCIHEHVYIRVCASVTKQIPLEPVMVQKSHAVPMLADTEQRVPPLARSLSHTHALFFSPSLPLSLSRSPLSPLTITNTLFSADYQPVPIFVPIITNWGHRDFIWILRSTAWSRGLVSLVFASETHLRFYTLDCGQYETKVWSLLPRKTAWHHPWLHIKDDY